MTSLASQRLDPAGLEALQRARLPGAGQVRAGAAGVATQGLAFDGKSLDSLKYAARNSQDPAAIKEAARQFEALFMREVIKSMREATMKSGLFEGPEGNLANDMLDQQLAVAMSGMPGGLSSAIERQLTSQVQGRNAAPATPVSANDGGAQRLSTLEWSGRARSMAPAARSAETEARPAHPAQRQVGFVQQHRAAADAVSAQTGIPAAFMLGQAGHETGWGRSQIRNADGSNSFNLFGIKATGGWRGKVAEVTTTEYIDGEPRKLLQRFRAYDSFEESFRDYAALVTQNPRYQDAVAAVQGTDARSIRSFAQGLQRGGYATDPAYADKLGRSIQVALSALQPGAGRADSNQASTMPRSTPLAAAPNAAAQALQLALARLDT
jgi:peptidoglycan hydrolase FlgJ